METKKVDVLEVLFWILAILIVIWVIYEIIKEISKGEQALEDQIRQDTVWMHLSEETSLRLSRVATIQYRLVIGLVILILSGCVFGLVFINYTYLDSIGIVFSTGGIIAGGISVLFYYKLSPDILLTQLKQTLLHRLYQRNDIKVGKDGRTCLPEHDMANGDISVNGKIV